MSHWVDQRPVAEMPNDKLVTQLAIVFAEYLGDNAPHSKVKELEAEILRRMEGRGPLDSGTTQSTGI